MPEQLTSLVKFRRFLKLAKGFLSLVLLVLEIVKRLLELL